MEIYNGFALELNYGGNYSIIEYLEDDKVVKIPGEFNKIKIDTIISLAFFDKINVSKIYIHENISKIENKAFVYLPTLSDVFIERYYSELFKLFEDCPIDICMIVNDEHYEQYKFKNKFYCFFKKQEYTSQQLGIGLIFDLKTNTLEITYPYETLYIPDNINSKILGIKNDNLEYIRDNDNCCILEYLIYPNLLGVRISRTITEISTECFSNTNIKFIKIPDNIIKINGYAFNQCKNLQKVEISENIEEIGKSIFNNTPFMKALLNNKNNKSPFIEYDNVIFGYHKNLILKDLTELLIPKNIIAIACESIDLNIESIVLNDKMKAVSNKAFYNCMKLKKLYIPKNIKSIGEYSFGYDDYRHDRRLQEIEVIYENKEETIVAEEAFEAYGCPF